MFLVDVTLLASFISSFANRVNDEAKKLKNDIIDIMISTTVTCSGEPIELLGLQGIPIESIRNIY